MTKKWEYLTLQFDYSGCRREGNKILTLTHYGMKGWELVSQVPHPTHLVCSCTFKRPIPEEA